MLYFFFHLLPRPSNYFYVCLIDRVARIFPNSYYAATGNLTQISSIAPLLRLFNPRCFTNWATLAAANLKALFKWHNLSYKVALFLVKIYSLTQDFLSGSMNQKMSSLFSSGLENLSEFHGWRIFPVIRRRIIRCNRERSAEATSSESPLRSES